MTYIDLHLKNYDKENSQFSLDKVIDNVEKNEVIVLLGSPGSGKSSLLDKYKTEHIKRVECITIKRLLKTNYHLKTNTEILLLDGLDEHRSISGDKTFVMTELGMKINEYKDCKIVISCREMDWYGEEDEKTLEDEVNKKTSIYHIQSLNSTQKIELCKIKNIVKIEIFIGQYDDKGFLDNPQMFSMLADIYISNNETVLNSKSELYMSFINYAREQNKEYINNEINDFEQDEFIKLVGYIACYYIFYGIETFNNHFIDEIVSKNDGYLKRSIKGVLKSKLFKEYAFTHRTIAEYACAYFLDKNKLNKKSTSIERIKSLFLYGKKIPTELRGSFAWLCSITGNETFIKIDPYYQIIHGDNSLFNIELKKRIILKVKEYAKENPYFFNYQHKTQFESIYDKRMDDFFMEEFTNAIEVKNHYLYFLINAIVSSEKLSDNMIDFLKSKVLDELVPLCDKTCVIEGLEKYRSFLVTVLNKILDKTLSDTTNDLKETLLKILYPKVIKPKDIVKYLMLYKYDNRHVLGHCNYLYTTPYKDKYAIVLDLHKDNYFRNNRKPLDLADNLNSFINDYFLETILKFDEELSAQDIYNIIKSFRPYYKKYESIKFHSYSDDRNKKVNVSKDKLQNLTNKLFLIYVKELKYEEINFRSLYHFSDFFNYMTPTNQREVLFSKMDLNGNNKTNIEIYSAILNTLSREKDSDVIRAKQIAEKYNILDIFSNWLSPSKSKWQIEDEDWEKKRDKETRERIAENEKYFIKLTDQELQNDFNALSFISKLIYLESSNSYEDDITEKTFLRLKKILSKVVLLPLPPFSKDLLSIKYFVNENNSANRNIDIIYYASLSLNKGINIQVKSIEVKKYLYINAFFHNNVGCIKKSDYFEYINKNETEFAVKTLKEYINSLFENYLPNKANMFNAYIKEESKLENLIDLGKVFAMDGNSFQDALLYNFISNYHFNIRLKDLHEIDKLSNSYKNQTVIKSLILFKESNENEFDINMVIALFMILESRTSKKKIESLKDDVQVKIVYYMFSFFNTEKSIEPFNGFQSEKHLCANFLSREVLGLLNKENLIALQKRRIGINDIWAPRIMHRISEIEQSESDGLRPVFDIKTLKEFLLNDEIFSNIDFFNIVYSQLNQLKGEIEENRNNKKDLFYQIKTKSKNEEACRDVILNLLDHAGFLITKEKHEANNRVDLNIRHKLYYNFEVQVECKKDIHSKINTGIAEQLIPKYLLGNAKNGIYLIFYFGDKKGKDTLLKKVNKNIPKEYKDNIKIILMDLTY